MAAEDGDAGEAQPEDAPEGAAGSAAAEAEELQGSEAPSAGLSKSRRASAKKVGGAAADSFQAAAGPAASEADLSGSGAVPGSPWTAPLDAGRGAVMPQVPTPPPALLADAEKEPSKAPGDSSAASDADLLAAGPKRPTPKSTAKRRAPSRLLIGSTISLQQQLLSTC
jgi:hypothetical protein